MPLLILLPAPIAASGEQCGEADDAERHGPFFPAALLAEGIVKGAAGIGRQGRRVGQAGSEHEIDGDLAVHRPSRGIKDRTERPAPQLQPCEEHGGAGYAQEDPHEQQGELPPCQREQRRRQAKMM